MTHTITSKAVNTSELNKLIKQTVNLFSNQLTPIVSQLIAEMEIPEAIHPVVKSILIGQAIVQLSETLAVQLAADVFAPTDCSEGIH